MQKGKQTFLTFDVRAATPLSFIGEGELSNGESTTKPLLLGGGKGETSVETDNFACESIGGDAVIGATLVEDGIKGVDMVLVELMSEGMTVRVLGFFHPCYNR